MSSDARTTRRWLVTLGEDDDDDDGGGSSGGGDGAIVEGCTDTAEAQGIMDPAGIIVMMSRREKAALRSIKAKMAFFHNFILERRGALKLYIRQRIKDNTLGIVL